jgi:peptidoglycan/xylan/chitin deacetylase (PgdA/CDA1 family)
MSDRTTPRVVVTTSWDDGHRMDPRLADLLAEYRIPGTFYIAPRNIEFAPADRLPPAGIRELSQRFEIGGHTLSHYRLPQLPNWAALEEIRTGRVELEDMIGSQVTSFCYPRGEYTRTHARMVAKTGFALARTVRRSKLGIGPRYEMATTVNAYTHRVDIGLALRVARLRPYRALSLYLAWDRLAVAWFDRCLREGGVFHLWGHSWEVDARRDWTRLGRVLAYISGRPGVAYLTNGELVRSAG